MDHEKEMMDGESAEPGAGKKIDVLLVEPGQYAKMVTIDAGLESLQKAVDGDIEQACFFDDPVALICNEEGKMFGLRPNRAIYGEDGEMVDIIVGKFLICGLGEENYDSLPKDMQEKYEKMFHDPEAFIRLGQTVIAIPTKPDRPTVKNPRASASREV